MMYGARIVRAAPPTPKKPMSDSTTIRLTPDTKDRLEARKQGDESFETVVKRLLGDGHYVTEDEAESIAERVVQRELREMNGRM